MVGYTSSERGSRARRLVTAAVGEDIPPDWDARRIGITLQDDESGRISVVNP